jgi:hypothetical protein
MADESKVQEKLKELRLLVRAGKERLATHSPVWAVYLTSETLRSIGEALDELQREIESRSKQDLDKRIRKTG